MENMKEVRVYFADDDYAYLRCEADRISVSLKNLVRDRALGRDPEDEPLHAVKVLSEEVSMVREALNAIIQRETAVDERLYEDDIIRLEQRMTALEGIVTAFVSTVLRQVKHHSDTDI